MGVVVLVGFAAYVTSLRHQALFHMTPAVYTEGVMDNSRLQNFRLLGTIFTSEFSIYTYGKYRPVGYALFALANTFIDSTALWHLMLVGIHLVNSLLVFAILRGRVDDLSSAALAVIWAVMPVFVPLVNDVNSIYLLWGIQFSLLSIWLLELYLQRRRAFYLAACMILFAVSLFTYRHAVLAAPVMVLLALFPRKWSKALVCTMVGLCLVFFLAALIGTGGLIVAITAITLLVIAASACGVEVSRFGDLVKILTPAAALLVIYVLVAKRIGFLPIHREPLDYIEKAGLAAPLEVAFVLWRMLYTPLFLLSVGSAFASGVVIVLRRRAGILLAGMAAATGIVATLSLSSWYRDDVHYWDNLRERSKGHQAEQVVQLQLAKANLQAKQWDQARELLFELKYVRDLVPHLELHVNLELAKLYQQFGQDKVAGFYYLDDPYGQANPVSGEYRKWKALPQGDFFFRLGYLSFAENFYGCAHVGDRRDPDIYKRLGKVLLYKNFYRAARKYFLQALSYRPGDSECLYHLAFLCDILGDDQAGEAWRTRWQEANPGKHLDFQPISDCYHFDKDKARGWFSDNPWYLFRGGRRADSHWIYEYQGVVYTFWEVPLEVGAYLYQRGMYPESLEFLNQAYSLKQDSKEALDLLVKVYQRLGNYSQAAQYHEQLEKLSNES
jgi:tetratricopeptide (TPR) repeat protein